MLVDLQLPQGLLTAREYILLQLQDGFLHKSGTNSPLA